MVALRVEHHGGVANRLSIESPPRGDEAILAICKNGDMRRRSGRDNHYVWREHGDRVSAGLGTAPHVDIESVERALKIVGNDPELLPSGRPSRELDLAAELVLLLQKRHLMAPQGRHAGRLHSADPATDDNDVQGLCRRAQVSQLALPSARRVLYAGDRKPAE